MAPRPPYFPPAVRLFLAILSQLGVTAFMFLVGQALRFERRRGRDVLGLAIGRADRS